MSATSVFDVADALLALLVAAHADDHRVTVTDTLPAGSFPSRLVVVDPQTLELDVAGMKSGRKARDERVDVDVVCRAVVAGGRQGDADRAAQGLYAVLADALADDPRLGDRVPGLWAATVSRASVARGPEGPSAHATALVATVTARVRLT